MIKMLTCKENSFFLDYLKKPFTKILKFLNEPEVLLSEDLEFPFFSALRKIRSIQKGGADS
jgi:hypothetical protein